MNLYTLDVIKNEKEYNRKFLLILTFIVIFVFTLSVVNARVFFIAYVSGESMNDTLNDGDYLYAIKDIKPSHGDIIVIAGEKEGSLLIKRAIAFGGDTIEIKNHKVYLNGEELNEPYAKGSTEQLNWHFASYTVPDGEVFYLGDNRQNSRDSRDSSYRCCKNEQIVGVVTKLSLDLRFLAKIRSMMFNNYLV